MIVPTIVASLAATALVVALAAPGTADEATAEQVRKLAHDAGFDDRARQRLRAIDEIDGRRVDLDRLLEGARGGEIEQRVEALLEPADAPAVARDPETDRAEARRILSQDRYRPDDIPRPFRGPLEWIAKRLEPVRNVFDAVYGWIAGLLSLLAAATPGGAATLWTVIGLLVVAAVAVQTKRIVERRGKARIRRAEAVDALHGDDPRDLEKRAAAARARGEHDLAVRLLFRAGVGRLARARLIPAHESLTTGEIRRLVRSPHFDRLGVSFDEIVYGRRRANDADSRAAREGWSELLRSKTR